MAMKFRKKLRKRSAQRQNVITNIHNVKKVVDKSLSFLEEDLKASVLDTRDNIIGSKCVATVSCVIGMVFIPLGIEGELLSLSFLTRISLIVYGGVCMVAGLAMHGIAILMAYWLPRRYSDQLRNCLIEIESDIEEMKTNVQQYLDKLRWFQEVHNIDQGLATILVREFSNEGDNSRMTAALLNDLGVEHRFHSDQTIRPNQSSRELTTEIATMTSLQLTTSLTELTMAETQAWTYFLQSGNQASVVSSNTASDDIVIAVDEAKSILEFWEMVKKWDISSTLIFLNSSIDKMEMVKTEIEERLKRLT